MSYHFSNSRVNTSNDDPVFLSLFMAQFVLPPPLRAKYGTKLLVEQMTKISGFDVDKMPDTVEQTYRNSKRRFAGAVIDTNIDFDTTFEVNVDEQGVMYPLNVIKDWCALIWNNNNAAQSLKRDYVGSIVIQIHNKAGQVIRKLEAKSVWPTTAPAAFDLEYQNEAIYRLDITWAAENVTDLVIDGGS